MAIRRGLAGWIGTGCWSLLAGLAVADNDAANHRALLEGAPLQGGQPFTLRVRSTQIGRSVVLYAATGVGPRLLADGTILQLDGSALIVASGVIGANGHITFQGAVPVAASGQVVSLQALVRAQGGHWLESNVLRATVDASATASFADATSQLPGAETETEDVDVVDLDRDGRPDLVMATSRGVFLLRNHGAGFTPLPFVVPSQAQQPGRGLLGRQPDATPHAVLGKQVTVSSVELADVDGDRDLDLLATGGVALPFAPAAPNALYLQEAGGFLPAGGWPRGRGLSRKASFGDLDGDGDLDLVIANGVDGTHAAQSPDPDQLFVNQGGAQDGSEGEFQEDLAFRMAAFNPPTRTTQDVALGDVDGDGDLDVLLADSSGPDVLLRNEGGLTFTDVSDVWLQPRYSSKTFGAEFADVDADGDLDLLLANSLFSSPGATLMRNQGSGVLIEDLSFPATTGADQAIRLGLDVGDVDQDGDLDVLLAIHMLFGQFGQPAGESLLFLNQGGAQAGTLGQFARDLNFTQFGDTVAPDAALLDYDNDGDTDIVIADSGHLLGSFPTRNRLLRNELN